MFKPHSNSRRVSSAWRALCAVISVSLLMPSAVVAQRQPEGRGADLRAVSSLPSKEKRWALIIGVDNYPRDITPLLGTVNDAKALRDALVKHAGFPAHQIILMTTDAADPDLLPNRGNILDALDRLSRQVPEDGLLLFSFSGHGISIGNDAFLIPSDGRVYQNVGLMRERSIDVLRIKQAIQSTKVKQVLMFLDACRNEPERGKGDTANPLTEAYKSGFSFDTRNREVNAFATIYATSIGDRAFEFFDKRTQQYRGYFSYAIEEALSGWAADNEGEVTLGGLIKYLEKTVRQRVYVDTNQRQVPYPMTEGFRNDELVLAIANRNSPTPTPTPRPSPTPPPTLAASGKELLEELKPLILGMAEASDRKDAAALNAMLPSDFTVRYCNSGRLNNKAQFLGMVRTSHPEWFTVEYVSFEMQQQGRDLAMVNVLMRGRDNRRNTTQYYRGTNIIVRRDGRWWILSSSCAPQ